MENKTQNKSTITGVNNVPSLTQENPTESNAIRIPEISLPKGGGALKGIDEKFEVNPSNGTAGFSIPLPISPGRNGFTPALSLDYNSGAGNGPYGLGWAVGFPVIQRKTDAKLPRYRDGEEKDTFMFSGAEDLVPYLEENNGEWIPKEHSINGFTIKRYRPRIEGGFARIEKIFHNNHSTYWIVTTRDNIVTIFGRNPGARIADPTDPQRIFKWLPEFSYDNKGNYIRYHYKNDTNIANDGTILEDESIPNHLYEKNRKSGLAPYTNTYLKRITYGNRQPYYSNPALPVDPQLPEGNNEYFFELVMDYGEHDDDIPTPTEIRPWNYREDAFSSYRSGFEIRTQRLCKRILMFHHFENEEQTLGYQQDGASITTSFGKDYLVSALNLEYEPSAINEDYLPDDEPKQAEVIYLTSVVQTGYIRKADGTYSEKSLPPMEFTYEKLNWNKEIKTVNKESIVNAPVGLSNNYQWVDLYNEGISGILTEQGKGWYYKSNLGDIDEDGDVKFDVARKVIPKPTYTGLATGVLTIQDLEANGQKQVVVNNPGGEGYFELTHDEDWKSFQSFREIAHVNLQDPNTRLIDLNGDGKPDLVITEENAFVWFASNGKKGHLSPEFSSNTFDEERGPAIVFADQEQSIFLADVSGDGLTDIVRIRNGEICYWANMGYGKFSAKISMSNAPLFDNQDSFNPRYLHLADVSGTGASDILYLGQNRFKAYINSSGNAWSDAHEIDPFFPIDSNTQISVVDLLGTGTSCIVWSSDLSVHSQSPIRYIDLMNSRKPHVMKKYVNNMGMETNLEYKSSTYYYLKDKQAGKPWITKLPFPVQVVSKQIVEEKITDVRFTSEYRYHHGYYDHPEREFRGFGMVEQIDTENYKEWKVNNANSQLEKSIEHYQKPVLTKTWFHTGAFLDRERMLDQFREEYWFKEYNRLFPEEPLTVTEPELIDAQIKLASSIRDQDVLNQLSIDEWLEALRACKGMMLRQEVFALDADMNDPDIEALKLQAKPYAVTTQNCHVQLLQPKQENQYAVFMSMQSEGLSIQYERYEKDPRITHTLNTKIDELGNVLEAASVVYPRKSEQAQVEFDQWRTRAKNFNTQQEEDAYYNSIDFIQSAQTDKTHIIYTQNVFTNDIISDENYLLRGPSETKTFEITGLTKSGELYKVSDFENILDSGSSLLEYHENPTNGIIQRRIIEHVRTLYFNEDLNGSLPLGSLPTHGIPYESYQLAYTPALIQDIYGDKISDINEAFETKGKYVHSEGDNNWWIRSGLTEFYIDTTSEDIQSIRNRFFSPVSYTDPFGATTRVTYYNDYFLFIQSTRDDLDNEVKIDKFDFSTLGPVKMRDINDNLSEVLLDELGMVKATALLGKDLNQDGEAELSVADHLNGLESISENDATTIQSFFQTEDSEVLRQLGRELLKGSSSRLIYDLNAYYYTDNQQNSIGKPTVIASITREKHHAHLSEDEATKIQIGFEYSDGGGNVVMEKAQAEPGIAKKATINDNGTVSIVEVNTVDQDPKRLRWIGNGRTILNNKGNPVKQYEPYFSVTPFFEDAPELVETGVTPILYYDSLDRNIWTELPDKTFLKVEFDSWKQLSYDNNDTVIDSQWYSDRINGRIDDELIAAGKDPVKERVAAEKVAKHHNTPGILFTDNLGRPVASIEHNKSHDDQDEFYCTRVALDIEGNPKQVVDARGNPVMEYKYDMLGHRVYQKSMDAGERWMLNNVMGNPVNNWDQRDHRFEYTYDDLQRPLEMKVFGGDGVTQLDNVYESYIYGETDPQAKQKNFRGIPVVKYDTAGKIETLAVDIKGNVLESTRQFAEDYKNVTDWQGSNLDQKLESGTDKIFISKSSFDALNRVVETVSPDGSITQPGYNEANLLETVKVIQNGQSTDFVKNIDYDEKGQRKSIIYGNNIKTRYTYDKETLRLIHLESKKQNGDLLQDLYYTYDPVGNISGIEDKSQQNIFFNGQVVTPSSEYSYDAIYRLTAASGREHIGQNQRPSWNDEHRAHQPHPHDGQAMRRYVQRYEYDSVGNILAMLHKNGINLENPGVSLWNRFYNYEVSNNRLVSTGQPGENRESNPYSDSSAPQYQDVYPHHPEHGFITEMPQLSQMQWNFKEALQATAKQQVSNGTTPETTYYVYDGEGQRARKITELEGGRRKKEERYYLGDVEIYNKYHGRYAGLKRTTLHVMDDESRIAMIDTRDEQVDDGTDLRTVRYQMGNHLGSVSLETNEDATVITYEEYHPYGTTVYQAKNAQINATAKRYRYTGMERDDETGLAYHTARYYLPWLGRWVNVDPEWLVDGLNLFQYTQNNPILLIDKQGKDSKELDFIELIKRSIESKEKADREELLEQKDYEKALHYISLRDKVHREWKEILFSGTELGEQENRRLDQLKMKRDYYGEMAILYSNMFSEHQQRKMEARKRALRLKELAIESFKREFFNESGSWTDRVTSTYDSVKEGADRLEKKAQELGDVGEKAIDTVATSGGILTTQEFLDRDEGIKEVKKLLEELKRGAKDADRAKVAAILQIGDKIYYGMNMRVPTTDVFDGFSFSARRDHAEIDSMGQAATDLDIDTTDKDAIMWVTKEPCTGCISKHDHGIINKAVAALDLNSLTIYRPGGSVKLNSKGKKY